MVTTVTLIHTAELQELFLSIISYLLQTELKHADEEVSINPHFCIWFQIFPCGLADHRRTYQLPLVVISHATQTACGLLGCPAKHYHLSVRLSLTFFCVLRPWTMQSSLSDWGDSLWTSPATGVLTTSGQETKRRPVTLLLWQQTAGEQQHLKNRAPASSERSRSVLSFTLFSECKGCKKKSTFHLPNHS